MIIDLQYEARPGYPSTLANYTYSPQMRREQYYADQRDPRGYDTMYSQQA